MDTRSDLRLIFWLSFSCGIFVYTVQAFDIVCDPISRPTPIAFVSADGAFGKAPVDGIETGKNNNLWLYLQSPDYARRAVL